MCGLAAATKLLGFFFFLTIPVYLLMARSKLGVAWKKIVQKALLFVCVMAAVIVLVNPFLWYEAPRNEMIAIQQFKQIEIKEGYTNGDPETYQKGPVYWKWTLENWFGSPFFLCFLIVSVIVGCFHRMIFKRISIRQLVFSFPALCVVFCGAKPDHYIFPALMPIFLTVLDVPQLLLEKWKGFRNCRKDWLCSFCARLPFCFSCKCDSAWWRIYRHTRNICGWICSTDGFHCPAALREGKNRGTLINCRNWCIVDITKRKIISRKLWKSLFNSMLQWRRISAGYAKRTSQQLKDVDEVICWWWMMEAVTARFKWRWRVEQITLYRTLAI